MDCDEAIGAQRIMELSTLNAPLITVVIPAYNAARYIGVTLDSVRAQSVDDWRCLVVDDGSVDDTAERVSDIADPRIQLIRQRNQGVSAARNRGLAECCSAYVMFLDGDDVLHPTALERLSLSLKATPKAVVAFGALRKILADGAPYPGEKPLDRVRYPNGDVLAHIIRENFLANGGQALVRTDAARTAGGFDQRLRLSEDWEFWCRLALEGEFAFIGAPPEVFSLRMTPGSASDSLAATWANHEAAVETVLTNTALQGRFSRRRWRRLARQVRASHRWEAGRVNFTLKRYSHAYQLMTSSLGADPRPKRLALFGLAIVSQVLDRSIVSRLRFQVDDRARCSVPQHGSATR